MFNMTTGKSGRGFCDGINRRNAIKIGGTGLLTGLTLPSLLEMQARAAGGQPAKAKAVIFFLLEGGPSHIDMWDLKPEAPAEIRGPFKKINTNVADTQISELLPHCAKIADKYTIMRSHSHGDGAHQTGRHWLMTGYPPSFADGQAKGMPFNELYPSIGSIISRELGSNGPIPPYVEMPNPLGPGGPGFFGPTYAPFTIETDPGEPDFEVRDLNVAKGIDDRRFQLRRNLLAEAEKLKVGNSLNGRASTMSTYYDKALSLVTSPAAKAAFDVRSETHAMRDKYGFNSIGQSALMARRLVEAGCRFIGIDHGSWDTHVDNFTGHEKALVPPTDQAFAALITDLEERGMLDDTLVVMMGEMGRTPKINADAGRDHWSVCQTIIFAGGGTKKGIVIGASDRTASYPTTQPYGIQDLLRTIFHLVGVDADKVYSTPLGRPVPIVKGGHVIDELLA